MGKVWRKRGTEIEQQSPDGRAVFLLFSFSPGVDAEIGLNLSNRPRPTA